MANNVKSGQPRIELLRTDRIVMFCVLCGGDVGPQPIQAVVLAPDSPEPRLVGHACVDCLHINPLDLADAIEEHADWLRELANDITHLQKLARAGRLQRPSLAEWQAANDAELRR